MFGFPGWPVIQPCCCHGQLPEASSHHLFGVARNSAKTSDGSGGDGSFSIKRAVLGRTVLGGVFLASSLADDQHAVGEASIKLCFYEPERPVPGEPPGSFMGGDVLAAGDSIILKPIPLAYPFRKDFPL